MTPTDHALRVIGLFNQLSVPYMLVGSFSSNFYSRPRMTLDADFVVVIQGPELAALQAALGPEYHVDPQLGFETVTLTSRYVITHRASVFKIELFLLKDDPFSRSRFERRREVDFEGHPTWLPSAEDVVVQKLRWARPQDIEDASKVLAIQRPNLDLAYIRHWTTEQGTRALFERLLAETSSSP